jgi:hypothetical protein
VLLLLRRALLPAAAAFEAGLGETSRP